MIRDLRPLLALLLASSAWAQEPAPSEPTSDAPAADAPAAEDTPEDPLAPYRLPLLDLAERTIGTASRPVAFDWRNTHLQLGGAASFLTELNNFDSARFGATARFPGEKLIFEVDVSWVGVWSTRSSRMLALTPYRQAGRPKRGELGLGVAVPLAEGIVTLSPRIFPAAELVFNGYAELRYHVYPTGFRGLNWKQVGKALLAPQLSQAELDNLDPARLGGMELDPARYETLVGIGDDLYFDGGFFVSPRVMVAVPLLAPATGTKLLLWGEARLMMGVAF